MLFHLLICGRGTVCYSEMVHVTQTGPELLTNLEQKLYVRL